MNKINKKFLITLVVLMIGCLLVLVVYKYTHKDIELYPVTIEDLEEEFGKLPPPPKL